MSLTEAVIAITFRCNLRCQMCNIWKEKPNRQELPPSEYLKLPRSLKTINITGGEPFLRDEIVDILKVIHDLTPKSRIVISTNGLLTERIIKKVSAIKAFHEKIGVGISIEGTETTHNAVRGRESSYQKAIDTVQGLKKIGIKDLRVAMTLLNENCMEIENVYQLAQELGVEFGCTYAHNSEIYFQKTDNLFDNKHSLSQLELLMRREIKTPDPKRWARAYFTYGI